MGLGSFIKLNLKNIPGKGVKNKYIVFESDDWGGIRMPSKDTYAKLLKANINFGGAFNLYDSLADKQDLEFLFEVLQSVNDRKYHSAVFTPVTNVANPDFRRIRESDFQNYFYEPFTETLKRYGRHPETFNTWRKGMELGIFVPELHGREHISVHFWLQKLREGDPKLRMAFDYEYVNVHVKGIHPVISNFRPEFYFNNQDQVGFLKDAIYDGVNLFNNIFGYIPRAFTPSNSIFHPVFEPILAKSGVKYLNVSRFNPIPDKNGNLRHKYYPIGEKSAYGITYYTRNCAFEPIIPSYTGIESTLRQIEAAFRWKKPAIISTHRANYIGSIDEKNRRNGLHELKLLLDAILKKWPEAEFISSDKMLRAVYLNDQL
jgi:hypothetical protein